MPQVGAKFKLKNTTFESLSRADGLERLDQEFIQQLEAQDASLFKQLNAYRHGTANLSPEAESEFLLAIAPHVDAFIVHLFEIEQAASGLQHLIIGEEPIFIFKNHFVIRGAKRLLKKADTLPSFTELQSWLSQQCQFSEDEDIELKVATFATQLLEQTAANADAIDKLSQWCAQALLDEQAKQFVAGWASFKLPQKLDYQHLVAVKAVPNDALHRLEGPPGDFRQRDGFSLTDHRMSERDVLSEIDYCVYCHQNDGDFCSKGFPVKKKDPELGLKTNPLGDVLTGCPLEEKISEMHVLKKQGLSIAALAMVMRDNPMCPATGHRICNDCMKACIYQKQDPVNIPEVETRILTDVLSLPWGVEIYDLLTRWNPLRERQYRLMPYNGAKIMVMGMGPAGFTMAYHLLMEGFAVVGFDGLKIEPLDAELINKPIHSYASLEEDLNDRVMTGFGGVAEYGITVRWDKNFLKLIYLTLMRHHYFQVFGSVRFGGTITIRDAWQLGFDHISLAVGAGLPKELHIPNSLAPGMRQANDFLMALQLTGAAKEKSLANLQVRMPAVVIGGGLTGVDTATEVQAYYIKQVEKMLFRYEVLAEKLGESTLRSQFNAEDLTVLDEYREHGRLVREERRLASQESRQPDFIRLLRMWGGVTIVYRRSMQESPAYKRNHEELNKALEEGIYYAEALEPKTVEIDATGYCHALHCLQRIKDDQDNWVASADHGEVLLPARSIFVATGAKPNVAYGFEHKHDIERQKFEYPRYEERDGKLVSVEERGHVKMAEYGAFTSYADERRFVSFIGDTHPIFHGSVVKAIASAKRSYPRVAQALSHKLEQCDVAEYDAFKQRIQALFRVEVAAVKPLNNDTVELTVLAPQLARNFKAAQFYRLQTYASGRQPLSEAVACLAHKHHADDDKLSFLLRNRGVSSEVLMQSVVGQSLAVMGPTGVRLILPDEPQILLVIGGFFAIAYILSIGPAIIEQGHKLYYLTDFNDDEQIFCQRELEKFATIGASLESLKITEQSLDEVHVIGYSPLLRKIQKQRESVFKPLCQPHAKFKGAVYGPMQCMLKGVCAQCLQWQIDPNTGKRSKAVYSCSWQHQPMEVIDFDNLSDRLSQNRMQECLTKLWYRHS